MLPDLPADPTAVAAIGLVVSLIILRLYFGNTLLHTRFAPFWGTARRLFMPVVDRVAKRTVGISAENDAVEAEHVGDYDRDPDALIRALQRGSERRLEVSVLSGLKTDWDGNTEIRSVVGYEGATPWPGAPRWLRAKQVHVFMFRTDAGKTRVAAHEEANSWRPDLWADHLFKGPSFDVEAGVSTVREWLDAA